MSELRLISTAHAAKIAGQTRQNLDFKLHRAVAAGRISAPVIKGHRRKYWLRSQLVEAKILPKD